MGARRNRTVPWAAIGIALSASAAGAQSILYVDTDHCPGPGSGTPADPFCRIQDALDNADDGEQIVVAAGTYYEAIDLAGKAVTLQSVDGPEVTLIDATGLDSSVVTCMSGEPPAAVIHGFTFTGGSGDPSSGGGGGMRIGGASHPTVIDCTITGNTAAFVGGGVFNDGGNATFEHCRITGNTAGYLGGGMATFFSAPQIKDCTFSDNEVSGAGGGMYNEGNPSPQFLNCVVINNIAQIGGGMYNNDSSPQVNSCRFLGNQALLDGGAVSNASSGAALVNCAFSGNSAAGFGGALQTEGQPAPQVAHCVFSGNVAGSGGAVRNSFNTDLVISNTILWDNLPDQIADHDALTTVRHSTLQGGWSGPGDNNLDADPLCVDADGADDVMGTLDDDHRLQTGSPCIDAASNALVPADSADLDGDGDTAEALPYDADGQPRFVDDPQITDCPQAMGQCGAPPVVDMGAFERQIEATCPADISGDGAVNAADLALLLGSWGANPGHPADLNHDGAVNAADLALLLGSWGPCQY